MRRRTAEERRRVTETRGRLAEALALGLLLLKGYRVLARRFSAAGGEVDLIVVRGGTVAFVEVKARGSLDEARVAIDARKSQRVSQAARTWLARNPWAMTKTLRGDAVFLARGGFPRHLKAAFELEMR